MALTYKAAFPQEPNVETATLTSANTATDGTTGTYSDLWTAGADGARLLSVIAVARATVTATAVRLFRKKSGGSYVYWKDALIAAHTLANTTENAGVVTIHQYADDPDQSEFAAGEIVACTIAVDLAGGISFYAVGNDY